jgi:DNA-binding transcriptional regulator/RsmH inhibitor MraZ
MGTFEPSAGNNGHDGLVRLFGYQETLSLDARGRFRLPDELSGLLHREMGRASRSAASAAAPAAFERLAFYFVPGTRRRVFLYPTPNIDLAVRSFDQPAPGMAPGLVRQARDYFYNHMRFVEADKQNRLVIPDALRRHAQIDDQVQHIALVAQNYWLTLSRSELVEKEMADNLGAFEEVAPDLLDPVYRVTPGQTPPEPQSDQ